MTTNERISANGGGHSEAEGRQPEGGVWGGVKGWQRPATKKRSGHLAASLFSRLPISILEPGEGAGGVVGDWLISCDFA